MRLEKNELILVQRQLIASEVEKSKSERIMKEVALLVTFVLTNFWSDGKISLKWWKIAKFAYYAFRRVCAIIKIVKS